MNQILLTQKQAETLLFELKALAKKYKLEISRNTINKLKLKTKNNRNLVLTCTYRNSYNSHLNIHDSISGLSLIRINMDNKFHKNLDGEIVRGNRINLYDEKEYKPEQGHFSYMRAYKLPYLQFEENLSYQEAIQKLLAFTNAEYENKLIIEGDEIND